ncbi:MAG: hypothetical protein AAGD06_16800, partial [Acidobacteriota bacterium]
PPAEGGADRERPSTSAARTARGESLPISLLTAALVTAGALALVYFGLGDEFHTWNPTFDRPGAEAGGYGKAVTYDGIAGRVLALGVVGEPLRLVGAGPKAFDLAVGDGAQEHRLVFVLTPEGNIRAIPGSRMGTDQRLTVPQDARPGPWLFVALATPRRLELPPGAVDLVAGMPVYRGEDFATWLEEEARIDGGVWMAASATVDVKPAPDGVSEPR